MDATTPNSNATAPFGLAPLWDALMGIYDIFAQLAEKHGWCWYVIGGNALGALRHDGDFIPWDDDLDLFMPRKDYAQLQKVANRELPPHLRWVDYRNTVAYPYLFGKIVDIRLEVHEQLQRQTGLKLAQGLFVDIWPLDGFPTTVFRKAWRWAQRQTLRLTMEYRKPALSSGWRRIFRNPMPFLAACLRPKWRTDRDFLQAMDEHAMSLAFEGSKLCGIPIHRWYELYDVCPTAVYGNPRWVPFHGRMVPIPHDAECYLRMEYGDWQTLPPPEQRCPTHEKSFDASWKTGPDQK